MTLLLSLFISFMAGPTVWSQPTLNLDTWLNKQRDTVQRLNSYNVIHLEQIKTCLCQRPESHQFSGCPSDSVKPPEFQKHLINGYGQKMAERFTCDEALDLLVFQRIRHFYPKMIEHMIHMRPRGHTSDQPSLSERKGEAATMYISTQLEHPIRSSWVGETPPIAQLSPLSSRRIHEEIEKYFNFSIKVCRRFIDQVVPLRKERLQHQGFDLSTEKICSYLIERKQYTAEAYAVEYAYGALYYDFAFGMRKKYQYEPHWASYAKIVQNNPLIALVSRAEPDTVEVLNGVDFLLRKAKERHSQAMADDSPWPASRWTYAYPFTSARLRALGWTREQVKSFELQVVQSNARKDLIYGAAEIGALVGTIGLCFLPWGKVLSVVAAATVRSGCLVGIGLPLNSFFLVHNVLAHQRELSLFFSTLEAYRATHTLNELRQREMMSYLFALTLPLGANVTEAGQFTTAVQRLLKN